MEQRRDTDGATGNVIARQAATDVASSIPEATDTDGSAQHDLLDLSEVTWDELCRVGGLLRVHPATLMAGAP